MDPLAYSVTNAIIREFSGEIISVWTPDRDLADRLRRESLPIVNRLLLDRDKPIEVIARMRRVYKRDGYTISGWIADVSQSASPGVFAGFNKGDAMRFLGCETSNYFSPRA